MNPIEISRRTACAALAGASSAGLSPAQDAAAINKELAARTKPLVSTTHPGAQWFPSAGLGLFMHWGIASVHGNIDISWGMMHGMGGGVKITPDEYFRLAERFQPGNWDPDRTLAAASKAGFRYAVLTAKHHEGFALWPSEHGEFNTRNFAGGRDLVGPYVEACRKHGMKVGFYYSPGDWYYSRRYMSFNYRSAHCWQNTGLACRPEVPDYDSRFQPVTLPDRPAAFDAAYRQYKRGQLHELLTRYGKVDLLWFDMADVVMTPEEIRALQPGIVINNRMGGDTGDFYTPEGTFPKERPAGWWELCSIWNAPYWGYVKQNEDRYLPLGSILSRLARTRAWGGNLLLNVGPGPDGSMPKPYWEGMERMAGWMKHSGEALFGTTSGAWPESGETPVTVQGNTWYLLVEPQTKTVSVRAQGKPVQARLLRTGNRLECEYAGGVVRVDLPAAERTELVDVVALRFA
ncbi:MAG: alpha-L-fucosidase [Bryobacterales bacterium]|nr:alpha-L-fucosidase [Bryobacterales bacterium]